MVEDAGTGDADAAEQLGMELLIARERMAHWMSTIRSGPDTHPLRIKCAVVQLSEVIGEPLYAAEAQRAGAASAMIRLLHSGDDALLNAAALIIAACSGPSASSTRVAVHDYGGVSVRVQEGPLGEALGVRLWSMAHVLCRELATSPQNVAGRRVLEIGSGCGACGIVAAKLGAAQVVLSDGDAAVLRNLRACMHLNAGASTPLAPACDAAGTPGAAVGALDEPPSTAGGGAAAAGVGARSWEAGSMSVRRVDWLAELQQGAALPAATADATGSTAAAAAAAAALTKAAAAASPASTSAPGHSAGSAPSTAAEVGLPVAASDIQTAAAVGSAGAPADGGSASAAGAGSSSSCAVPAPPPLAPPPATCGHAQVAHLQAAAFQRHLDAQAAAAAAAAAAATPAQDAATASPASVPPAAPSPATAAAAADVAPDAAASPTAPAKRTPLSTPLPPGLVHLHKAMASAAVPQVGGGDDAAPGVEEGERFEVVIGSDVMYDPDHARLVAAVVHGRLALGGRCLLGVAVRQHALLLELRSECAARGLLLLECDVTARTLASAATHGGVIGRAEEYEGGFLLLGLEHLHAPAAQPWGGVPWDPAPAALEGS